MSSGCKKPPRINQPSIKYRWNPAEGASFELGELVLEDHSPTLSENNKKYSRKSEAESHKILSTAALVSSLGKIWDSASHLAIFQAKANMNQNHLLYQKEDALANLGRKENRTEYLPADSKFFSVDSRTGNFSSKVGRKFESLKVTNKRSEYVSFSENHTYSVFWRHLNCSTNLPSESWKGGGLATVSFSYELRNMYQWMRETIPTGFKYHANVTENENKKISEYCIPSDTSNQIGGCISTDGTSLASDSATANTEQYSSFIKSTDPSAFNNAKLVQNRRENTTLCSDYFVKAIQDTKAGDCVSRKPESSLYADYNINFITKSNITYKECQHLTDRNKQQENKNKQPVCLVTDDEDRMVIHPSAAVKPQYALAKQEHAFAGALAGIFVSLCLHPVDTVKTVIQSCRAEQKSICYIGRSIVSERGLTGLYRGIASNIASSAPTSAIYTFTYESVKGVLLPLFPKEYSSLAHCMAGGCASIATSFIFTPSECIKQQMQVGTHYYNCWNALVGILKNGGLPSLYAGWGAVLCRNVPHSIIKFYAYERLKQLMLTSVQSCAQTNTLKTLVCGGLAGSTAAFVTTPFDVVKTRLQTQKPGSLTQYNSVFHALQEIAKQEGLKGLYRGLIPRLVIYMSQGALFFASYELFKSIFSLEVPKSCFQSIQHKEGREDDTPSEVPLPAMSSPSTSIARSSSQPRMHSLHS